MAMTTRAKRVREKEDAKVARAAKRRSVAAPMHIVTRSRRSLQKDNHGEPDEKEPDDEDQVDEKDEPQKAVASSGKQTITHALRPFQVDDRDETCIHVCPKGENCIHAAPAAAVAVADKPASRPVRARQTSRRSKVTRQPSTPNNSNRSSLRMSTRAMSSGQGSRPRYDVGSEDDKDDDDYDDDDSDVTDSDSDSDSPGSPGSNPSGLSDSEPSFRFLDLPLSVRTKIYDIYAAQHLKHSFPPIKIIVVPSNPKDPSSSGRPYMSKSESRKFSKHRPALLRTSPQIYEELLPSLLSTLALHMDDWIHPFSESGEDIDMASATVRFASLREAEENQAPLIKTVQVSWHMRNLRSTCSSSRRCSPSLCLTSLPLDAVERLEIKLQTYDDGSCEPEGHDEHLRVLKLAQPGLKALLETAVQTCPKLDEVKFIGCFGHEWLNFVQDEIMRPNGIGVWRGEETWSKEWTRGGDMRVWEWCK